ncbi:MAG: DUF2062 domain-containing protein [Desulfobia sp.]
MKPVIIIPVYNHASTLPNVVGRAIKTGWPVLVVDDGSTDQGIEQLYDTECRILRLDNNQGKGAAILAGARQALKMGGNAIITIDADDQHDPAEAPLLVKKAEKNRSIIVIGCREMSKNKVPRSSRFGRAFSNFWVRLECGLDLPDTQSGFRLYPIPEILYLNTRSRRYDFEVEIITRAAWSGIPIASVPVNVYYPEANRRTSHFHWLRDNLRLTVLHTVLICRALIPLPHKKNIDRQKSITTGGIKKLSVFHPVQLVKKLCLEHSTSFQLAVAVWMGIFLGALPLLAVHTIVIIYVCHRLHLNKPAAVAASQLCAPPLVPAICIETGYFMRNSTWLTDISWDTLVLQVHQRLWEWLLGSLLVGPLLGFFVAVFVYTIIRYLRIPGKSKVRSKK